MKFEDLQNQWQKEGANAAVQINYDILLKEVKRGKSYFDAMVFWRDVREIVVGVALVIFFLVVGIKHDFWPLLFMSGCILFICLFLFMDRIRNTKNRLTDGTLKDCVGNSLAEVNHQIWLLRNVFWWYLLPGLLGFLVMSFWMEIFINRGVQASLGEPKTVLSSMLDFLVSLWLPAALFVGVYWLNQWAVKAELLPRKKELEDLLCSIDDSGEKPPANEKNIWPVVFLSILISLLFSVSLVFISRTSWVKNWLGDTDQKTAIEITPPLLPQEAIGPKELKILSARYGAKKEWVDVTGKVADAVHENTLSVHSGNELTGEDPIDGYTKTLEVECLWDGQKKTIRVREGTNLKIPFESDPNTVRTDKFREADDSKG
jgi:hypothetical protein